MCCNLATLKYLGFVDAFLTGFKYKGKAQER